MAETKKFHLRVLLTVTTGRLLTKGTGPRGNGIGDLYELLGWMTNDSPYTHQLGRFAEECKPWLLRWFPEIAVAETKASMDALDLLLPADKPSFEELESAIQIWLAGMIELGCKKEYDVPRIPADDHERKHPYDELVAMRGTDEGIVVVDLEARRAQEDDA